MDQFVHRESLAHYRRLLAEPNVTDDPIRRARVNQLLAKEMAKGATMTGCSPNSESDSDEQASMLDCAISALYSISRSPPARHVCIRTPQPTQEAESCLLRELTGPTARLVAARIGDRPDHARLRHSVERRRHLEVGIDLAVIHHIHRLAVVAEDHPVRAL